MRKFLRLSSTLAVTAVLVAFLGGIVFKAQAQTSSATPDFLIAQITSSDRDAFVVDISGDGRFVVIESTGNLAPADPAKPTTVEPNNADGNREIFLFDYAQRRLFQITNTKSALKVATNPATDISNIDVDVSNNRPMISNNGRFIVFSSNAYSDASGATPASFVGNDNRDALKADGNQEIFLYQLPDVATVGDLSRGTEQPATNLAGGTFIRVTNTPPSRRPEPGSANTSATVVDDNRFATINDDASFIAFVSSRNLSTVNGLSNADGNPEIYVFNRGANSISQITNTANPANSAITSVFSANPSISADGSVIAFISTATIAGAGTAEPTDALGNAEIFVANFNGTTVTNLRQVTRTKALDPSLSVNFLSPGRRLSRNGNLLAFESTADLPGDNSIKAASTGFIYNIGANTFTQVGPRASQAGQDVLRFPVFTDNDATIVFVTTLNFRPDGSAPPAAADGLNPNLRAQIFAAPVAAPSTFTRLTNTPAVTANVTTSLQPFASNSLRRMSFSLARTELGGGNSDGSTEAFYLIVPAATSETPASANAVAYFTGASERPVAAASPTPTPPAVAGLAPGMLAIGRSTTVALAPSSQEVDKNNAREDQRRPPLPVELNGVSVSLGGAAVGLYFVSAGQINFVLPPGLGGAAFPVTINNNGAVIRSTLQVIAAQPDIFTDTSGRAAVFNATNPMALTPEPSDGFPVTSDRPKADGSGTETVPTELLIMLTGVRNAQRAQITVRINQTDLSGDAIVSVGPSLTAGFDQIIVRLPASLAGAGDVPVIVTATISGQTFTSRAADGGAPRIRIR